MTQSKFAICTENKGYEASLELRKLYQVIPDSKAQALDQIRVIDESGDDYLFPAAYFAPVDLPSSVAERVKQTA